LKSDKGLTKLEIIAIKSNREIIDPWRERQRGRGKNVLWK
jgi:hypothetical protein